MHFNQIIPPEKENQWTAFLNGEPALSDVSNAEAAEMDDFTAAWEAAGNDYSYSNADTDKAWLKLQKEMNITDNDLKFRIYNSRIFRYAAMIVMVMGIGLAAYQFMGKTEKQLVTPVKMVVAQTEVHPANLTVINLPDGSTVKMNANTRIEYPEHFSANVRKIKLSGEAFFEVTKDTACPFIIDTEMASVEVMGTSFNVSAYPRADLVEVNVETGKVKLSLNTVGESIPKSAIIPAGERGWLNVANNNLGKVGILSSNYSSWITKKIIFQRTPLADAFTVLENTYHVKIIMENPEIGRIPYTANFADLKLDYIVDVIARTHRLKVKKSGNEIIFARIGN